MERFGDLQQKDINGLATYGDHPLWWPSPGEQAELMHHADVLH